MLCLSGTGSRLESLYILLVYFATGERSATELGRFASDASSPILSALDTTITPMSWQNPSVGRGSEMLIQIVG
jgi:hypothetical protein